MVAIQRFLAGYAHGIVQFIKIQHENKACANQRPPISACGNSYRSSDYGSGDLNLLLFSVFGIFSIIEPSN